MTSDGSWSMPLRTKLLARTYGRLRGSIENLDAAALTAKRRDRIPGRPPFTWVTGPVHRDVRIGSASFRARDGVTLGARTYRPASARPGDHLPCVVWLHGGGWMLGSPEGYDPLCTAISHEADVVVISVDYRRSPEHRAPQAALDCVDALRWVTSDAERIGIRADGIGVAGDSAGGNLAAVASQVVRDEGGADIGHLSLIYPAVDATMSQPSVAQHDQGAILTRTDIDVYLAAYLGPGPGALDASDPLVSPLFAADLAGLPPTLVQTADLDPLRDEGRAYAARLLQAGVPVRATNYHGVPHGFMSFPGATLVGRAARDELLDWIGEHARKSAVG